MKEQIIIENQVAIFNLVCALFREVTGKNPQVMVSTSEGILTLEPTPDTVISQEEVSRCPSGGLKETDIESLPVLVS